MKDQHHATSVGSQTSWQRWLAALRSLHDHVVGTLAAYIVTVGHTIHCGVWLYVIDPVVEVALIVGTGAISIAAKHRQSEAVRRSS